MQKKLKYTLYTTFVIPIIFIFSILLAREYGGHLLFHTIAEIFSISISLMVIVIVSYTYKFTKNNFILYLGLGYFWVGVLDLLHMLTYQGMSVYSIDNPNIMLTFWLAARFLEAFILFSAIFVNFRTISKSKVFVLFGLVSTIVYMLAFSYYVPVLYEQGSGLTSLKINLEYTIVFILILTIFIYTKRIKSFDKSIYYYIMVSLILTICSELTLTIYAQVDDSFTMLAHLFKFLSFWMIFLAIIKTSLEEPFKLLAHESSTYNSIPFPSILVDSQGVIRQINNSTTHFLSLEKDNILNQSNHMLFHDKNTKEDKCKVCLAIKNGETLFSYTLQRESATLKFTVNPISIENVALGSVQVCIDISQEVKLERDKVQIQERLKLVVDSSTDGIWDWNLLTNEVYFSPRWKELIGYKDEEIENKLESWKEHLHAEDEEQTLLDIKISQEGKTKDYKSVFRFKHKNGHYIWIEARGQTLFDEDGKAVRMIGSHTDITKQQELEKSLQQKQSELFQMIEASPVAVFVLNKEHQITHWNIACEKMTGLLAKDMIGTSNQQSCFYETLRPVMADLVIDQRVESDIDIYYKGKYKESSVLENVYEVEDFLPRLGKDGKWVSFSATALKNADEEIIGAIEILQDISERKRDEFTLIDSEERLHLIIENSPVGICTVDLLGNFISTNSPYEKMLGYSKKELSKLSFYDITHPDYRPKNRELFQKMFSLEASGFDMEKVYICKDSKEINVSVHAKGINDETGNRKFGIAFIEDITEKKHSVELLEQKKQELETTIQEAPNPIMIHSEDGKVILVNKVWEQLTGYSHKDIDTINKWTKKAYGIKMPVVKEYIDKLYSLNQKVDEGEYEVITKDSRIIIWQFSSAPLGIIDGKRTVISSAMDITELKQKDNMLINQSRHAAMGEMIGMIAHQWRQPLSAISMDANNMLLDIAMDNLDMKVSEEYANSIAGHTQHLSQTIDDFRNFFKPDKVIYKVNIKDILEQTLSIVKDSLKNNNIELTRSIETQKEVDAYPRELMQVFVNIITNAKDALVSNKIEKAQINIRVYEDEKYVNIEVLDNGGGIDLKILPKVFDPYFSTKDEKTGTGLGLYMSKMIIEEHLSGRIEISNSKDGVCCTVGLLK